MKQLILGLFCFFLTTGFYQCLSEREFKPQNYSQTNDFKVDTRLGTGGIIWSQGHVSPAAAVPFGVVNLGPDTHTMGLLLSSSGYSYSDGAISGFSLTRYSGTGIAEGGLLRITPANSEMTYARWLKHSLFLNHDFEVAEPGYYSISFPLERIQAEMTAQKHGGAQRYSFGNSNSQHLILELTSTLSKEGRTKDLNVQIEPKEQMIEGHLRLYDGASERITPEA